MKRLAIIIPLKQLEPKSRLSKIMTLEERMALQLTMLADMLKTINKAKMINDTFIVTSDETLLKRLDCESVRFIKEPVETGVNGAILFAISRLTNYDGWILLPADIPLLSINDLEITIRLFLYGFELIISPSRKMDGTNLLLMLRDKRIDLHYDDNSFEKHFAEAQKKGLKTVAYYSTGIGLDLDDEDDLTEFLKTESNTSTFQFLTKELNRTRL
ncbi:MAG: 2-phospho-L-lactate guanylyltransferase [Conexivisphaerales archaeon]